MKKIYVGNLPFRCEQDDLRTVFEQFGGIEDLIIIKDRETGRSKGFAFVEFENQAAAQEALSMDGKDFQGRPLKVNVAKERTERERGSSDRGDRGDRGGRSGSRGGDNRSSQW